MEVLYHGIKTRYAYDFPLCFPHELIMSLRSLLLKTTPQFPIHYYNSQSKASPTIDTGISVEGYLA